MSVAALVERTGLAPRTVSAGLAALVREGFIERTAAPGGGRRIRRTVIVPLLPLYARAGWAEEEPPTLHTPTLGTGAPPRHPRRRTPNERLAAPSPSRQGPKGHADRRPVRTLLERHAAKLLHELPDDATLADRHEAAVRDALRRAGLPTHDPRATRPDPARLRLRLLEARLTRVARHCATHRRDARADPHTVADIARTALERHAQRAPTATVDALTRFRSAFPFHGVAYDHALRELAAREHPGVPPHALPPFVAAQLMRHALTLFHRRSPGFPEHVHTTVFDPPHPHAWFPWTKTRPEPPPAEPAFPALFHRFPTGHVRRGTSQARRRRLRQENQRVARLLKRLEMHAENQNFLLTPREGIKTRSAVDGVPDVVRQGSSQHAAKPSDAPERPSHVRRRRRRMDPSDWEDMRYLHLEHEFAPGTNAPQRTDAAAPPPRSAPEPEPVASPDAPERPSHVRRRRRRMDPADWEDMRYLDLEREFAPGTNAPQHTDAPAPPPRFRPAPPPLPPEHGPPPAPEPEPVALPAHGPAPRPPDTDGWSPPRTPQLCPFALPCPIHGPRADGTPWRHDRTDGLPPAVRAGPDTRPADRDPEAVLCTRIERLLHEHGAPKTDREWETLLANARRTLLHLAMFEGAVPGPEASLVALCRTKTEDFQARGSAEGGQPWPYLSARRAFDLAHPNPDAQRGFT